jgi:regulator of protease activity HflC (stomatin/prohibitin superfamily)
MGKNSIIAGCCGFVCVSIIVIVCVVLGTGLHSLESAQLGIAHNTLFKTLSDNDGQPYKEGMSFWGAFTEKIIFQKTNVVLDLRGQDRIRTTSKDGILIRLDITAEYKLIETELIEIAKEWGTQDKLEQYVKRIAQDALRSAASDHQASEFYTNKTKIAGRMREYLDGDLAKYNAHATLGPLQILGADFPPEVVRVFEAKQTAEAAKIQAERTDREASVEEGKKLLEFAREESTRSIEKANGQARGIVDGAKGQAPGLQSELNEKAESWDNIRRTNSICAPEFVDGYLYSLAMQKTKRGLHLTTS